MSFFETQLRAAFFDKDQGPKRNQQSAISNQQFTESLVQHIIRDIHYATRGLLRQPAFTALAVLTLALGIGANTAIFSVVNTVLLKPLDARDPHRLMTFWHSAPQKGLSHVDLNDAMFAYYRERTHTFENLAAFEDGEVALTGNGEPEVVPAAAVTFNYFSVLGREPVLGRAFSAEEDTPGKNNVSILSYGLWQRRFAGNRNIIGQSINIDNSPSVVVGVMPAGFDFPDPAERESDHIQVWVPKGLNPQDTDSWNLSAVGRLKTGMSPDDAQKEITSLYETFAKEYDARLGNGALGPGTTTVLMPLQQHIVGNVRKPLLLLLGSIALVLLIACANLTNLLLARAASRTRELAIRQCLGASARRIFQQSLTESLLLSSVGAVLGLLVAVWTIAGLKRLASSQIPHIESVRIDSTVLFFTIGVMLVAGVFCGLAPAIAGARLNLREAIQKARDSALGSNRRLTNAFVVTQLGLSLVLLVGAALLLQSFRNLLAVNPGFRAENVLMARLSLPEQRYANDKQVEAFYDELRRNIQGLPGVKTAELCQVVPFSGDGQGGPFTVEGHENERPKVAWLRSSTPGYFNAMGMPVLKGRTFDASDTENSPHVAIVDEKLVRMYWQQTDPLGKRIRIGSEPWLTIVGVVPNVKNRRLDEDAWPYIYRPYAQWVRRETMLVVKTSTDPSTLISSIRQQVTKVDPELPISGVSTIEQAEARSLATTKLVNFLLTGFAIVALFLALIGIYGLVSLNVNNRRREFGIRLALGAQTSNVLRIVLRQGTQLAFCGVTLGLLASFLLTRFLKGLLFEVGTTDPLTFLVLAACLVVVALLACWIPARRATKVDPVVALRNE
ncbi:MAG: hypothetical protein C5B55_08230 [Blastocatellia bacterium]|nr:MAG: hypothetical protein C5B55_08230 [Blastocatellia bacterium]